MPDQTPLDALRERRQKLLDELEPLVTARRSVRETFEARTEDDDEAKRPTDEERSEYNTSETAFNADMKTRSAEIKSLDARIEQEEMAERSRAIAASASRDEDVRVTSEPLTYREDNQRERSYFLDLAATQIPEVRQRASARIEGYQERLDRHSKEIADVLPKRWAERERIATRQVEDAERATRSRYGLRGELEDSPFERAQHMESRAPSRIVGQGGYAVPPLWLIDEYIPALRPGRVAAGLARNLVLPEGTDSINIPRLATPTLTQIQGADGAPVASRDFTDTFQQANVKTIAGQEDVPIQLIEQAPGQILDRVLMTDLIADYNQKVDLQVLTGNGTGAPLSGGQVVGIYPANNWGANTVQWTNATPTAAEYYQVLGAMASKTAYSRFNLQDFAFLTHPRRWFWAATAMDTTNRPLGTSSGFGPYNPQQLETFPVNHEGLAGTLPWGPKMYIDANVPITDSAGTPLAGAADISIGAIWDDMWLFEGDLRTRVLSEVLSGTLELRFQVYGYLAFLCRYGSSITLSYGTAYSQPYTTSGSTNGVAY